MRGRRRRSGTVLLAGLLALGALIATPAGSSVADHGCVPEPWPSFAQVAPTARRVVIGTVREDLWHPTQGRSTPWFRFEIDEVVRGSAPRRLELRFLDSGMPTRLRADTSCENSVLTARVGDRFAIAEEGILPGTRVRVTTIAVLSAVRGRWPGADRMTASQVRRIARRTVNGTTSRRPFAVGPPVPGLVTRRVAPGVGRIVPGFTSHDLGELRHLGIAPDGTPWAATQTDVFRLDVPRERSRRFDHLRRVTALTVGLNGDVLVEGWGPIARFDGRRWSSMTKGDTRRTDFDLPLVTTDGTLWAVPDRGVARLDEDGWNRFGFAGIDPPGHCFVPPLGGRSCAARVSGLVEAPDGSLWAAFDGRPDGGIRRFDGTAWSVVDGPPGRAGFTVTDIVASPDGSIWASIDGLLLARWDGERWTSWPWPSWMRPGQRRPIRQMEAAPDGSVWFERPLMRFDGLTWRRYEVPARSTSDRPRVEDLEVGPDGTVWLIVRDLVKFRTTRPDGLYVLDPSVAEPIDVELAIASPSPD